MKKRAKRKPRLQLGYIENKALPYRVLWDTLDEELWVREYSSFKAAWAFALACCADNPDRLIRVLTDDSEWCVERRTL